MLHDLIKVWFLWVEQWGYWGVFVLMAMESSIIPVPSEIVLPPAAFWAAQGKMSLAGVIIAGTLGSYLGSILSYLACAVVGRPLLMRYGKYVLISPEKLAMAEAWVNRFGFFGIFLARLLPVVRHLISMPAGLLKMRLWPFSIATLVGAGLWCAILSWFGQEVLGDHPDLLHSPEALITALKAKMIMLVLGIVGFTLAYLAMILLSRKLTPQAKTTIKKG